MKPQPDKTELRRRVRLARSGLSKDNRSSKDASINQAIIDYAEQSSLSVIGAYIAFDGEPSLDTTFECLLSRSCVIALPVIVEQTGGPIIEYRQWSTLTKMKDNRYGIPEPQGTPTLHVTDLDLALIPLVAWDTQGGRLGMGAGFYDRLLRPWTAHPKPVRAGVAYELQKEETLPTDPWDVELHQLFSEEGLIRFKQENAN